MISVVAGAFWGDEGKGKIVDFLAQNADAVVRWNGGDNAGHTIVVADKIYKFHLMPAGIVNKKSLAIVGNGCVLNPQSFIEEINYAKINNLFIENIRISERVHIIFPYHVLLDKYQEEARGKDKIGTTAKGIGPVYVDKVKRSGIRAVDFVDPIMFGKLLKKNITYYNKLFTKVYKKPALEFTLIYNQYTKLANKLKKYVCNTSKLIYELEQADKKILFEGAQGAMLDIDHGSYPFVTSSSPLGGSISTGSGISVQKIDKIIGVTKAYISRVGSGRIPTILENELGQYIRKTAHEYGTTTGRPRDVGWLDAVVLKHSVNTSSLTELAVTLLDILTNIKELKICVSYELDGQIIDYVPTTIFEMSRCIPQYIIMPGWTENITGVTSYKDLPLNAQKYLDKIEELAQRPVTIFSVGPKRKQTIIRSKNTND